MKIDKFPGLENQINKADNYGKQGIWVFFGERDSIIFMISQYDNDTLNGYFTRFWGNGNKSEEGYYKKGLLDSLFTAYWGDGKTRANVYYRNGLLNGTAITFNQNGDTTTRIKYIDGLFDSSFTEFYIDKSVQFDSNNSIIKIDTIKTEHNSDWNMSFAIYRNDSLTKEMHFFKNKICIENFYKNTELVKRIVYFKGLQDKIERIFYFNNGVLISKKEYDKNGKVKKN